MKDHAISYLYPLRENSCKSSRIIITKEKFLFGSELHCEIRVYAEGIQSEHCILTREKDGKVFLEPLSPTALVLVNCSKISGKVCLKHNDVFSISSRNFHFNSPIENLAQKLEIKNSMALFPKNHCAESLKPILESLKVQGLRKVPREIQSDNDLEIQTLTHFTQCENIFAFDKFFSEDILRNQFTIFLPLKNLSQFLSGKSYKDFETKSPVELKSFIVLPEYSVANFYKSDSMNEKFSIGKYEMSLLPAYLLSKKCFNSDLFPFLPLFISCFINQNRENLNTCYQNITQDGSSFHSKSANLINLEGFIWQLYSKFDRKGKENFNIYHQVGNSNDSQSKWPISLQSFILPLFFKLTRNIFSSQKDPFYMDSNNLLDDHDNKHIGLCFPKYDVEKVFSEFIDDTHISGLTMERGTSNFPVYSKVQSFGKKLKTKLTSHTHVQNQVNSILEVKNEMCFLKDLNFLSKCVLTKNVLELSAKTIQKNYESKYLVPGSFYKVQSIIKHPVHIKDFTGESFNFISSLKKFESVIPWTQYTDKFIVNENLKAVLSSILKNDCIYFHGLNKVGDLKTELYEKKSLLDIESRCVVSKQLNKVITKHLKFSQSCALLPQKIYNMDGNKKKQRKSFFCVDSRKSRVSLVTRRYGLRKRKSLVPAMRKKIHEVQIPKEKNNNAVNNVKTPNTKKGYKRNRQFFCEEETVEIVPQIMDLLEEPLNLSDKKKNLKTQGNSKQSGRKKKMTAIDRAMDIASKSPTHPVLSKEKEIELSEVNINKGITVEENLYQTKKKKGKEKKRKARPEPIIVLGERNSELKQLEVTKGDEAVSSVPGIENENAEPIGLKRQPCKSKTVKSVAKRNDSDDCIHKKKIKASQNLTFQRVTRSMTKISQP